MSEAPMTDKSGILEKYLELYKDKLAQLSPEDRAKFEAELMKKLSYVPKIGIFGKTGVGKSSFCNALFGADVCAISDVDACTRNPQEVLLKLDGGGGIQLIDVPGVGESGERDKEYDELYQNLLPNLDAILWIFKGDDRAAASDEHFYNRLIKRYTTAGKPFLAVVNQCDKIEPFRQWDEENHRPGPKQMENIERKVDSIANLLKIHRDRVIAVSANEHYNLHAVVEALMDVLPDVQKTIVLEKIKQHDEEQIRLKELEAQRAEAEARRKAAEVEAERLRLEREKEKARSEEARRQFEMEQARLRAEQEEREARARREREEADRRRRERMVTEESQRKADKGVIDTVVDFVASAAKKLFSLFG